MHRYTISQRIARTFSSQDRVFLCGDAAHTHSSGAAQGLNTGIHDAVNLGWKLALTVQGTVSPDVLKTYSVERQSAVQKLINYDKDISLLMTHKWPAWYNGDPDADPYLVLGEIFERAASFNTGLGISYTENVLNQSARIQLDVVPGSRPPDIELTTPGTNQKIRFQRVTPNLGKFWVVVFTGRVVTTRASLVALQEFLNTAGTELQEHPAIGWITISTSVGCSPYEALGMKPFGSTYYDAANGAHEKLSVDLDKGCVVVLRPDGLVGSGGPIDGVWVTEYFARVLRTAETNVYH